MFCSPALNLLFACFCPHISCNIPVFKEQYDFQTFSALVWMKKRPFSPVQKASYLLQISRPSQMTRRSLWGLQEKSLTVLLLIHLGGEDFHCNWQNQPLVTFSPGSVVANCGDKREERWWEGRRKREDAAVKSEPSLMRFFHTLYFYCCVCVCICVCVCVDRHHPSFDCFARCNTQHCNLKLVQFWHIWFLLNPSLCISQAFPK